DRASRHALHRERSRRHRRRRVAPRGPAGLRASAGRATAADSRLCREQYVPDARQHRGGPARGAALRRLRHGNDAPADRSGADSLEPEALALLKGAERALAIEVDETVEIEGRGPLSWRFVEYSPFNPR